MVIAYCSEYQLVHVILMTSCQAGSPVAQERSCTYKEPKSCQAGGLSRLIYIDHVANVQAYIRQKFEAAITKDVSV